MLAPNLKTAIDGLAHLIENADAVLPFTGAGISTECGIPDFRSPGGIWARMQPIPFDAFMASQEMRNEAWRRRFAMADEFQGARPGRGHRALASLYQAGKAPAVITQNIDNLHQESGIAPADVVELHGNTTYAVCLGCAARYELPWVRQKFEAADGRAPDCDCGGYIKTATVSFGQAMPEAATARAAPRSWCGPRPGSRCSPSATERGWRSSTASRPSSTTWPISSFTTTSEPCSRPS